MNHSRNASLYNKLLRRQPQNEEHYESPRAKVYLNNSEKKQLFWMSRVNKNTDGEQMLESKLKRTVSQSRKNLANGNHLNLGVMKSLDKFSNLSLESGFYVLETSIKECSLIHAKLGHSNFNQKNCFVDENEELCFHLELKPPYLSLYSSNECEVVRDIIECVHKLSAPKAFDDFYFYYKRTLSKNKCDFKYTQSLIKSYCSCSKIRIAAKIETINLIEETEGLTRKEKFAKSVGKFSCEKGLNAREACSIFKNKKIEQKTSAEKDEAIKTDKSGEKNPLNYTFNSTVSVRNEKNKEQGTKQSTISTNFKSSNSKIDSMETSSINVGNYMIGSMKSCNESEGSSKNPCLSLLNSDLEEVQSLGESSDLEETQVITRKISTPRNSHEEKTKKENEERILSNNKWTRKIDGLFLENNALKESFTSNIYQSIERKEINTKKMGKLNRTIAHSNMPSPPTSEFKLLRN